MLSSTLVRFELLLKEVPAKLAAFTDAQAGEKTRPGKWSKKEIMGHLIDSAANNHQRFVRLQAGDNVPLLPYEQDTWVKIQHYNDRVWTEIVQLWQVYNTHLLHVMRNVKNSTLGHIGVFPDNKEQTLKFIMEDYVVHMEHHLRQTGITL